MNFHKPERQPHETWVNYKLRRKEARIIVDRLTLSGKYRPAGRNTPNNRESLRANKSTARHMRFADLYMAHLARTYRQNKGATV